MRPDDKETGLPVDQMLRHTVETVETRIPGAGPFACFEALSRSFGDDGVFILESLSHYDSDAEISLVGANPVVQVRGRDDVLEVAGVPAVVSRVIDALCDEPGTARLSPRTVRLSARARVWVHVRQLGRLFNWKNAGRGDRFSFGLFGYFGYDMAWSIETLPRRIEGTSPCWDLCLGLYQLVIEFDRRCDHAVLRVNNCPLWSEFDGGRLAADLARSPGQDAPPDRAGNEACLRVRSTMRREDYNERVAAAREHIRVGDIYQVQLGHEIVIETAADPLSVYKRMREQNPSPFMYLAGFGECTVIGASPELFVRVVDGKIVMRPIAGTIGRGRDEAENRERICQLSNDQKEIAEHVMLVDLCRNDIGRICRPGSLMVSELMVPVTYSHVNHMVSTVSGQLSDGVDSFDVIKATFPAGTMTGAPKIRAMEIIESLELSRRGIYAGAIGLVGFDGYLNTALCIRSAVYERNQYVIRASAGIVADSVPEREWLETLHKMAGPYRAITKRELLDESCFD